MTVAEALSTVEFWFGAAAGIAFEETIRQWWAQRAGTRDTGDDKPTGE